jgi:peptidoglycan glycosyltransferase
VLAKSVPTPASTKRADYPYDFVRQYSQGPLYAGITGYDSALYYGTSGIEEEYNSDVSARQQAPQTLSQLIFRQKLPMTTDNLTLTSDPALQQVAWNALTSTAGNNDGAVVVLNPKTGRSWPWCRTQPTTPMRS